MSRCPYSPCRSPSLEKGFHYTSESVSSGLKSDPDGPSCIWALFFVGLKVAGLRNACCLGLFQIKSRIFRVHVLIRPEPRLGAHCPLGAQPGGERIREEGQMACRLRPMRLTDGGRSWDKLPQGQGGLRTGKPQGTPVQNGQGLVNSRGVGRQVVYGPLGGGRVGRGQQGGYRQSPHMRGDAGLQHGLLLPLHPWNFIQL